MIGRPPGSLIVLVVLAFSEGRLYQAATEAGFGWIDIALLAVGAAFAAYMITRILHPRSEP